MVTANTITNNNKKPYTIYNFYFFFQIILRKAFTGIFISGTRKPNICIGQKYICGDAYNVNSIYRRIVCKARYNDKHGKKVYDNRNTLPEVNLQVIKSI